MTTPIAPQQRPIRTLGLPEMLREELKVLRNMTMPTDDSDEMCEAIDEMWAGVMSMVEEIASLPR
jgi:hypothetical protein